jgi:hypothetical protein
LSASRPALEKVHKAGVSSSSTSSSVGSRWARRAEQLVFYGSWLCENALRDAWRVATLVRWRCIVIFPYCAAFATIGAADADLSRPGQFFNCEQPHVGGNYARNAARTSWTPMMFMTRVRL